MPVPADQRPDRQPSLATLVANPNTVTVGRRGLGRAVGIALLKGLGVSAAGAVGMTILDGCTLDLGPYGTVVTISDLLNPANKDKYLNQNIKLNNIWAITVSSNTYTTLGVWLGPDGNGQVTEGIAIVEHRKTLLAAYSNSNLTGPSINVIEQDDGAALPYISYDAAPESQVETTVGKVAKYTTIVGVWSQLTDAEGNPVPHSYYLSVEDATEG